jgi:hypothetical protein
MHRPLHVNRTAERCIGAAEFEQHPVACSLDDPAIVFGNLRVDDAFADLAEPRKRSSIITFHVSAEANDIGDQDRGELASDGTSTHGRSIDTRRW